LTITGRNDLDRKIQKQILCTNLQKELDETLPEDLEDVAPIYEKVCENKQDIFMELVEKLKQDS